MTLALVKQLRQFGRGIPLLVLVLSLFSFTAWRFLQIRPVDPIVVNWNSPHQIIDGFGASATGYVESLSQQQAEQFFSPEKGLGLSLLRIRPIADTLDEDCGCVANAEPYKCVQNPASQIVAGDLQVAKLASSYGVKLIATPWSPPAAMKSSGKYCGGGKFIDTAENRSRYAGQLMDFVSLLRSHKLSIEALSIQNEPDVENNYDTCRWTDRQIHDFIPVLNKALSDSGNSNVKIAAPEQSIWSFDLMSASMKDPAIAPMIGIVYAHAYESENPSGLPAVGNRHVWQTEASSPKRYDGGMTDALAWARSIHNYMTIGVNAWMYWSLDCGKKHFHQDTNMCLSGADEKLAKRAYVLGQFAKFVRPGWQRVGVLNKGSLLVTAFKSPLGRLAIVVINPGDSPARQQSFVVNGVSQDRFKIVPWITSDSQSLEAQAPIPLEEGHSAFTATVPGHSVVTFYTEDNLAP
jgi:glucuronoarabinoxylan endo-1,4-beta-xylanase